MITALYNLFVNHHMFPDEFYGVERNDMARTIMLAFSQFEVKQRNDALNKSD